MKQDFRTTFEIRNNPIPISYNSKILSLGSCFSETIGGKLQTYKMDIAKNPFGTIFNPISIFTCIQDSIEESPIDEKLICERDGVWSHYDSHSQLSSLSKGDLLDNIKRNQSTTKEYLQKGETLILTFGSAYAYELTESGHTVANCHKMPSQLFNKRLLSVDEIVDGFRKIYQLLHGQNNIILTVSPVRHTKDSITLNAVSKATLRLACHMIKNEFKEVRYFPSYELLLDDLRDYRFYESDLLHPNEQAIDYIWDKFSASYLDEKTKEIHKQLLPLIKAAGHKPFHPGTSNHIKFVKDTISKLTNLPEGPNVDELIEQLERQLD